MSYLLPLSDFVKEPLGNDGEASYYYEGRCPDTGEWLRLPRDGLAEAVGRACMRQLERAPLCPEEGKMYGVLVVETTRGTRGVLRAFSGQIQGRAFVQGWVPPLPGHEHIALDEAETLAYLADAKRRLIALSESPTFDQLEAQKKADDEAYQALAAQHNAAKEQRQTLREEHLATLTGDSLQQALAALKRESYEQSITRRDLRRVQQAERKALEDEVAEIWSEIDAIRRERKLRSRELQAQMHAVYTLTNFAGETRPLDQLAGFGNLPTGTGDCCAPKLLYYAATHGLKPLGLAEFWWGAPPARGGKVAGAWYGACEERCQPIMGFLLSGLPATPQAPAAVEGLTLDVIYEDHDLLVVNKPSGLLSVPGRRGVYDSVASRVRHLYPDVTGSLVVHRLDMQTSGVMVVARHPESHRLLSAAFKHRQVEKRYVAIVCGDVPQESGVIELPIWSDPDTAPKQAVDYQHGKPCLTHYEVLAREDNGRVRLLMMPHTGRTHQLRVHASHPDGLAAPILGDLLYGEPTDVRIHLHARDLMLTHPITGQRMEWSCPVPF